MNVHKSLVSLKPGSERPLDRDHYLIAERSPDGSQYRYKRLGLDERGTYLQIAPWKGLDETVSDLALEYQSRPWS